MRKAAPLIAIVAVFAALPASAGAREGRDGREKPRSAAKLCQSLRAELKGKPFRSAFASERPRKAFRKCVRRHRGLAARIHAQAMRECRAHLAEDPVGFALEYGAVLMVDSSREVAGEEPPADKSVGEEPAAFRRCVAEQMKALFAELRETYVNAVEVCRAERAENREAFEREYGTNHNRRNAFGKCVSRHARDGGEREGEAGKPREGEAGKPSEEGGANEPDKPEGERSEPDAHGPQPEL